MHGIRRGVRPSEAQLEQERRLAAHAASVIRQCLVMRRTPLPDPISQRFLSSYKLVETAVLTNPDEYTLWAFRREVLRARLKCSSTDTSVAKDLWQAELKLTTRALRNHPKAYPAWQHRIWLLSDLPKIDRRLSPHQAIRDELNLTQLMLTADARNFHGWAHRMRVRAIERDLETCKTDSPSPVSTEAHSLSSDEKELEFVHSKINDDFANYSAWHHRSVLLSRIHATGKSREESGSYEGNSKKSHQDFIRKELQFVKQAFYTEPDVQSVWFYHRWLLAGAPVLGAKIVIDESILRDELASCDELIDIEPEARYAWLVKAHILVQLGKTIEALKTLDKLEQLDPMRRGYYAHLKRKVGTRSDNGVS